MDNLFLGTGQGIRVSTYRNLDLEKRIAEGNESLLNLNNRRLTDEDMIIVANALQRQPVRQFTIQPAPFSSLKLFN